jgi:hypothetical protein
LTLGVSSTLDLGGRVEETPSVKNRVPTRSHAERGNED